MLVAPAEQILPSITAAESKKRKVAFPDFHNNAR